MSGVAERTRLALAQSAALGAGCWASSTGGIAKRMNRRGNGDSVLGEHRESTEIRNGRLIDPSRLAHARFIRLRYCAEETASGASDDRHVDRIEGENSAQARWHDGECPDRKST